MPARKTLTGALALLGEEAKPSDGRVDIIIEDRLIHDIRPSGAKPLDGTAIDLSGKLLTAGLRENPDFTRYLSGTVRSLAA